MDTQPLLIVGTPDADLCAGDFCAIPEHHLQAVVNRAIDAGNI